MNNGSHFLDSEPRMNKSQLSRSRLPLWFAAMFWGGAATFVAAVAVFVDGVLRLVGVL
jgi:hypothetical protein